ncbi:hypothetical protein GOP47_0000175 [Adiantum capillus-veneris]|uniref:Bifunctional lysine-specific demethylase and histidyl-hydroxylase n=1 Tax=Adiantum capillus-veneris TaxID=13818 RepID=A0A9D4VE89_ADICA|nr:hypothetical protein GOP47_0000175 [Adiantum capillus-veneris]
MSDSAVAATNKRKRTDHSELLVTCEDDKEAEHWIEKFGQEVAQPSSEKVNGLPARGSINSKSQEDRENSTVLAVVLLLVFLSKHRIFHPVFQKSVMASIRSIRRFFSSSSAPVESLVFQGSLAAMPALLCNNENLTVVKSIALLGDMALHSYQSMMQIVSETQVLQGLLSHLNSANTEIQREACHTVASIASGTQGQTALCDLGAVEKLMHLLFVLTGVLTKSVDQGEVHKSLDSSDGLYLANYTRDSLLSDVLEALDMLSSNNCFESLRKVSQGSRVSILKALQIIWKRFRNNCDPRLRDGHAYVLAKMIVWLAMALENFDEGLISRCEDVVEIFFGGTEVEFEHFWDEHWEHSPFLIYENAIGGKVRCNLLKAWQCDGDSLFLKKLLSSTLTCPPFSCDELETSQIYSEIENDLGKLLIFGQDIRLVKSVCTVGCWEPCSNCAFLEEDYHKIDARKMESSERSNCLDTNVNTFVTAYELGYTIALRGLEFRCSHIADIAEALAVCFGQATVGANLYMTPLNAQGFKPHYDDHCVFVWQLAGSKFWNLWDPETLLPRLYSQDTKLERGYADEEDACKLSLKEGNILYIPRGFPHAANTRVNTLTPDKLCCTFPKFAQKGNDLGSESCVQGDDLMPVVDADSEGCLNRKKHEWGALSTYFSGNCSCLKKLKDSQQAICTKMVPSLHITFGVEVEPPFDWEGLVHMSLECWWTEQNGDLFDSSDLGARDFYKGMLHVAVRQCGDKYSSFRKGCLIAAKSRHKEAYNIDRFESFFKGLIQEVAKATAFNEVMHMVLTAIDTPASTSLDWMHWLRHLSGKHETTVWSDPVTFFHDRLIDSKARSELLEDMEVKFSVAKDSFVSSANYAQACVVFIGLLQKYRTVRRKYMNGMLALHV